MWTEGRVSSEFLSLFGQKGQRVRVSGVFSSALYLEGESGRVLLLHDNKYGFLPFGIGVADITILCCKTRAWEGIDGYLDRYSLSFDNHIGIRLKLGWQEPDRRLVLSQKILAETIHRGIEKLEAADRGDICTLISSQPSGELEKDPFIAAAREPLTKFRIGMMEKNSNTIRKALLGLLGLGRGLTPSMDDFLLGFLYLLLTAERAFGYDIPERKLLAEALRELAPLRTNRYSAAYLLAAVEGGHFSLLDKLLWTEEPLQEEDMDQLLKVGSGSGKDMLAGAVYGLQYLCPNF